jgi:two-component system cell cycle response regulator DivK
MLRDDRKLGASKRILIVEDNALNMKLLRDVLDAYGYVTIATGLGDAAFGLACAERPDLVLMDLQLPDISGFDAVQRLKGDARTRDIPVVAVTAFALPSDEQKALASGCDGYIAKPIALNDFLDIVERFLGPRTEDGAPTSGEGE